jgi:hypothetical protein
MPSINMLMLITRKIREGSILSIRALSKPMQKQALHESHLHRAS